jgi:DHA2 family multidrug resistance protein
MAVYGMAVVLAPALGPTLGGFITDHYSWRWCFFINIPVGILSLFLSNRMITDPPHLVEARKKRSAIDFVGLGLLAIGLGALEVVLDKGQEEDWFHSPFITAFAITAAVGLVTFVIWEWRHKDPIVDVKLFKSRSFAASNVMMLSLGIALYGTTVMLPQYAQVWLGWSATDAGMMLSPGGMAIIALMPLVGFLVSRVDARKMIAFGFALLALSLLDMSRRLYPGLDFSTAVWMRVFQSVGIAFLFVPINTSVYADLPKGKSNSVSGIVNLSRNMGGDIGIALVTTLIARRSQVHQVALAANANNFNTAFTAKLAALSAALQQAGYQAVEASRAALRAIYLQVVQQAQTLAYIDTMMVLVVIAALMIPLVFLTRKPEVGGAPMAH